MSTVVKDLGAVSAYAYAVEKGYTGTEAEFAELMADYAEVGQRAEDAADSALESKTAAQTAATTATNKASEATTAAQTATTKAAEAQADADAAALDASQALSAASTATTKATEATTAAATATSAATTATTAKDDAVSAKTAAQTAQTGAETAAASVQSSAAQIATNTEDIGELRNTFGDIRVASSKFSYTGAHSSTRDKATLSAKAGDMISVICKLSVDPVAENLTITLVAYDGDTGYALRHITTDTFQATMILDHDCDSFGIYGSVASNSVDIELYIFNNGSVINLSSNNNEHDIEQMSKNGFAFFNEKYFKYGSLSNGNYANIANRICNHPHIFTYPYDLHLTADAGYRFGVHTMTADGTFVSDSGWQTDYIIPSGTPFRIVIAKSPDSTVVAYVYEFVKSVHFLTNSAQKIADIASGNLIKTLSVPWESDMHRGYSSPTVHENTIPAFYRAWKNGATMIEVDARLSSDGIYVSNHDATITVNGTTYTIANETADTLTHLVLSTDATYGDCCIPLLETVLNLCCFTGMKVNLDCKQINPTTLAKLVVDCGMSGKVIYANTSIANAQTILSVDPNAGFIFAYSDENLVAWYAVFSDYHTRQRSYAWSSNVSYDALEKTRSYGFKYLLAGVTTTALMPYVPDCIEFEATANCKALNETYINSLSFVP